MLRRLFTRSEAWLVAILVTYGFIFIRYGHAGLPLGVAVSYVWARLPGADFAIGTMARGSSRAVRRT